jgi:pyruvate, orthophosphate dikinase
MPTRRSRPRTALAFGATGIGLCRTEHMFFEGNRIDAMREMILADNVEDRKKGARENPALPEGRLCRHLQGVERIAGDDSFPRPAAARIPPARRQGATGPRRKMGVPVEKIKQRVKELHEFNPMLGFRGCRLGIVYPEISEMQARAVFEAAAKSRNPASR